MKQVHNIMNHTNARVVEWFRQEYPKAMNRMGYLGETQHHESCPPCTTGKATRAPLKQQYKNRYELFEAVSTDATVIFTLAHINGNKCIQILNYPCSGWTDV